MEAILTEAPQDAGIPPNTAGRGQPASGPCHPVSGRVISEGVQGPPRLCQISGNVIIFL